MFAFKNITLTQFRNYSFRQFAFSEKIIAVCGKNGTGKTNLIDALYYTCFTKSYFSADAMAVQQDTQGFRIETNGFNNNEFFKIVCILRENNKKEFYVNDSQYKKFSNHIGKFPCVVIAPDDTLLITGSGEERRRFIDTILSQLYPEYLQLLIDYNKILQQRNSFLKATAERNYFDEALLDILDKQIAEKGQEIYFQRSSFLINFLPLVIKEYISIAEITDRIEMQYYSQLNSNSLAQLLKEHRQRDLFMQRTSCGIHKDDLEIFINKNSFKTIASQGQRKSLLFALKLAEFASLKNSKGFAPVLLLDDVFEKLDARRMQNLLYKVCVQEDAQVFITDTHKERVAGAFSELKINFQLIEL